MRPKSYWMQSKGYEDLASQGARSRQLRAVRKRGPSRSWSSSYREHHWRRVHQPPVAGRRGSTHHNDCGGHPAGVVNSICLFPRALAYPTRGGSPRGLRLFFFSGAMSSTHKEERDPSADGSAELASPYPANSDRAHLRLS